MYGLITETDDVIKKRCYEYRYRVNNKVTANSCDIQRFLKNIGHKISPTNVVDCSFGNMSATAVGTWLYGAAKGINTVNKLWLQLKTDGYDVGQTSGFGPKMATAVSSALNKYIPGAAKKCKKEDNLSISDITDSDCMKKINSPWHGAMAWWRDKIFEKGFYNKLKSANNFDDWQTNFWINEYNNYLLQKVRPYCLKPGYDSFIDVSNPTVFAYATEGGVDDGGVIDSSKQSGCKVVQNPKHKNLSEYELKATFIHEIQHCLYFMYPMTPDENWKKLFPVDSGTGSNTSSAKVSYETNKKYGVEENTIKKWEGYVKNYSNKSYICDKSENASRIVGLKYLLGYTTSEKITVQDFKKFLNEDAYPYNDSDAYHLCMCWVKNGAEDIKTFLDDLDKYIVAKNTESNQSDTDINKPDLT